MTLMHFFSLKVSCKTSAANHLFRTLNLTVIKPPQFLWLVNPCLPLSRHLDLQRI